jgi:epoxyqueuosine reductase
MNLELWQKAIFNLKESGLNLFASTKIENLPKDILDSFTCSNIPYQNYTSLICIGHGGSRLWENLPANKSVHPLDSFTVQKIDEFMTSIFKKQNHIYLYPHAKEVIALQKLGRALNLSAPSPIGIDINKTYGLWFAFRAVCLIDESVPEVINELFASPCDSCNEKPCLKGSDFWAKRGLCPYKSEHIYPAEQLHYHQALDLTLIKHNK